MDTLFFLIIAFFMAKSFQLRHPKTEEMAREKYVEKCKLENWPYNECLQ